MAELASGSTIVSQRLSQGCDACEQNFAQAGKHTRAEVGCRVGSRPSGKEAGIATEKRRSSSYPVADKYFSTNPPIVLTQSRLADGGRQVVDQSRR